MSPTHTPLPRGFSCHIANIGIKDATVDFVVVAADTACSAAGMFTRSRFAGPSVVVSRDHVADGLARAVVVISKNANVATGDEGLANTHEVVDGVAAALGCDPEQILIASTGVIGRQYPMDRIRAGLSELGAQTAPFGRADAFDVATGIMTTDTVAKIATSRIAGSDAVVVGVAKGVGMIEPDMATLITLIFTDADVAPAILAQIFRAVIDRTFNCVSIDTDTSTSDTAIVLASGSAGPVENAALVEALFAVALSLTKQVARDGEGAEKLIEVTVDGAPLFTSVQATWNVLETSVAGALAEAADAGAWVLVKEPVANGRLAPGGLDSGPRAARVHELATQLGVGVDVLAIAAALAQPWTRLVLSGAVTPEQVASNASATRLALPWAVHDELATLADPAADYWAARSRRTWT